MTKLTLRLFQIEDSGKNIVGGKAVSLAKMAKNGLRVPTSLCITTEAFDRFLEITRLRDKILMEYYRKRFEDMRWEEIWDLSSRRILTQSVALQVKMRQGRQIHSFFL